MKSPVKDDKRREVVSHVGEILRDEFLKPMGISVYALSKALKVPYSRINNIVLGKGRTKADMALRFARFFDMSPYYWLNIQNHYDLVVVETEPNNSLAGIITPKDIKGRNLVTVLGE